MKRLKIAFLAVLMLNLPFLKVFAQTSAYKFLQKTPPFSVQHSTESHRRPGVGHTELLLRTGETHSYAHNLAEEQKYIIEFQEEPLFISRINQDARALNATFYVNRMSEFQADLNTVYTQTLASLSVNLTSPQLDKTFHKVFFGASVKTPRALIGEIARLPYVKRVHRVKQVQAHLMESVSLIQADSVWSAFETQGDSVVVAIIDTGIDFDHPALGGGFGPGFKVIGGYDTINDDDNPDDDHGHGTHVAGIVAANGDSIRGVAPNALLMAFKALNQNGFGDDDAIIAAIERTVDPNNDGDFSDRVDIANMSLGGFGHPEDAMSTAVNNAVQLGVVFSISAGNRFGFGTIGSPGTAASAITVGASDKDDMIAPFSSKGPAARTQALKPELLAPGVQILSADLKEDFIAYNGTSMSAPHVAGVAALLKSIHPDWTPAQIKSAIVNTAVDLELEAMIQGNGRIDALAAAQTEILVEPAALSFGLADPSETIWSVADTMTVWNVSGQEQTLSFAEEKSPQGANVAIAPSQIAVAPGDSAQVVVTLTVDNNAAPFPTEGSLAFDGAFSVSGASSSIRVPWAFVKASKLVLTADFPVRNFYLLSEKAFADRFSAAVLDEQTFEVVVPKGIYDVIMRAEGTPDVFHFSENIEADGVTEIVFADSNATHRIELSGVDEQGGPMDAIPNGYTLSLRVFFPESSLARSLTTNISGRSLTDFRSTTVSERFRLLAAQSSRDPGVEGHARFIEYPPLHGLDSSITLMNQPSDFLEQTIKLKYPKQALIREMYFGEMHYSFPQSGGFGYFISLERQSVGLRRVWESKVFLTPSADPEYGFTATMAAFDTEETRLDESLFQTPTFRVDSGSIASFDGAFRSQTTVRSPNGGELVFGGAPIYTDALHDNNRDGGVNISAFPKFFGPLGEYRSVDVERSKYMIFSEFGDTLSAGVLSEVEPIEASPGKYVFEARNENYFIADVQGNALLRTTFDLDSDDPNPPVFTSLRIQKGDGVSDGVIERGQQAVLQFSAADFLAQDTLIAEFTLQTLNYAPIAGDSTHVFIREFGGETWTALPFSQIGEEAASPATQYYFLAKRRGLVNFPSGVIYNADLSNFTQSDSTAYDLRLVIQDAAGNTADWTISPAFIVGGFDPVTAVADEDDPGFHIPRKFELYQNFPNPFNPETTFRFDLPKPSQVSFEIYDLMGRRVRTLLEKKMTAGEYSVLWDGKDNYGRVLPSGVYYFKITAGTFNRSGKAVLLK